MTTVPLSFQCTVLPSSDPLVKIYSCVDLNDPNTILPGDSNDTINDKNKRRYNLFSATIAKKIDEKNKLLFALVNGKIAQSEQQQAQSEQEDDSNTK